MMIPTLHFRWVTGFDYVPVDGVRLELLAGQTQTMMRVPKQTLQQMFYEESGTGEGIWQDVPTVSAT